MFVKGFDNLMILLPAADTRASQKGHGMCFTNKAMHGTMHAVLALHIQSLTLCIAMRYNPTGIGRRHTAPQTIKDYKFKIGGRRSVRFRCDVEHRYGVTPHPDRRSSPSTSIGMGPGAVLRAEQR